MKIVKTTSGQFGLLYGPKDCQIKFLGGLLEMMHLGIKELGIPKKEMFIGISEMVKNNHDVIEFGDINGTFLYTRKGRE